MNTDTGVSKALDAAINNLPRFNVKDRQIFDLELLLVGGFAPVTGFMGQREYTSVLTDMRLRDGSLFPLPIVLDVPQSFLHQVDDQVVLCDPYGNPLAILTITDRWQPDKVAEAQAVYGTTDDAHPGVRYLYNQMHGTYIGGTLEYLNVPVRHDFKSLRHTPKELQAYFKSQGWSEVVAFQTRNPMHRVHFELVKRAHEKTNLPVLVHPVVGMTREGDIDYITRVRTYQVVCEKYGPDFTKLSLLPLAMRMAGPREVLWHMIVRRNYGCTHFIVGRDHAGPGKDAHGNLFYEPYEARDMALRYAEEIGMTVVPSDELAYVPSQEAYVSTDEIPEGAVTESISGTEFRRRLVAGESIPEWFSFPESIAELQVGVAKQKRRGLALFFTGLSGAGKSTIANVLATKLLELQDREVTFLDGDIIRAHLSSELGFSKEHRDINVARVGYVASEIAKHGGIAICSLVAPYRRARMQARELVEQYGTFIEVHVATPLAVCEERDTKGLYQKARQGLLTQFTGIDDPYEVPESPELYFETVNESPEAVVDSILEYLVTHHLIVSR